MVVNKKVLFTHINVLPCFDYCVENNINQKKSIISIMTTKENAVNIYHNRVLTDLNIQIDLALQNLEIAIKHTPLEVKHFEGQLFALNCFSALMQSYEN